MRQHGNFTIASQAGKYEADLKIILKARHFGISGLFSVSRILGKSSHQLSAILKNYCVISVCLNRVNQTMFKIK